MFAEVEEVSDDWDAESDQAEADEEAEAVRTEWQATAYREVATKAGESESTAPHFILVGSEKGGGLAGVVVWPRVREPGPSRRRPVAAVEGRANQ